MYRDRRAEKEMGGRGGGEGAGGNLIKTGRIEEKRSQGGTGEARRRRGKERGGGRRGSEGLREGRYEENLEGEKRRELEGM